MAEQVEHIEKTKQKTIAIVKRPRLYKVVLLNDDFTPMDFVVDILQKFFAFDETKAVTIMLQVHNAGKAVCGIFSRDVAETKVVQVNEYAKEKQYPLLCQMEVV